MHATLRWKKTIGIIAIILGGLRFITGISSYSDYMELEATIRTTNPNIIIESNFVKDVQEFIAFWKNMFPLELITLGIIFILGITLLCVDRELTNEMSHPKSRKVCLAILITAIIHLILEVITWTSTPVSLRAEISPVTIISSLGFVCVLIVFCTNGLWGKKNFDLQKTDATNTGNEIKTTDILTTEPQLTPLDIEIAELKKQIEKRRLEKEIQELNAEKQAEIERLTKELEEMK